MPTCAEAGCVLILIIRKSLYFQSLLMDLNRDLVDRMNGRFSGKGPNVECFPSGLGGFLTSFYIHFLSPVKRYRGFI